jgi:hypothetical protein
MAHATTHAVHKLSHDGKANALTAFASTEEGQKDLPLETRGYSRSVVAHRNLQTSTATLASLYPHARHSQIRRGLFGVIEQRQQRLLQLSFVGL